MADRAERAGCDRNRAAPPSAPPRLDDNRKSVVAFRSRALSMNASGLTRIHAAEAGIIPTREPRQAIFYS